MAGLDPAIHVFPLLQMLGFSSAEQDPPDHCLAAFLAAEQERFYEHDATAGVASLGLFSHETEGRKT